MPGFIFKIIKYVYDNFILPAVEILIQFRNRSQIESNSGMNQRLASITVTIVLEIKIGLDREGFKKGRGAHKQLIFMVLTAASVCYVYLNDIAHKLHTF